MHDTITTPNEQLVILDKSKEPSTSNNDISIKEMIAEEKKYSGVYADDDNE
jgi:hypothetical protein